MNVFLGIVLTISIAAAGIFASPTVPTSPDAVVQTVKHTTVKYSKKGYYKSKHAGKKGWHKTKHASKKTWYKTRHVFHKTKKKIY